MEVRHEPFGEGKDGVLYWYLDLGPSNHASLTGKDTLIVQREWLLCDTCGCATAR